MQQFLSLAADVYKVFDEGLPACLRRSGSDAPEYLRSAKNHIHESHVFRHIATLRHHFAHDMNSTRAHRELNTAISYFSKPSADVQSDWRYWTTVQTSMMSRLLDELDTILRCLGGHGAAEENGGDQSLVSPILDLPADVYLKYAPATAGAASSGQIGEGHRSASAIGEAITAPFRPEMRVLFAKMRKDLESPIFRYPWKVRAARDELIQSLVASKLADAQRISNIDYLPSDSGPWQGELDESVLSYLRQQRFSIHCCCTSAGPLAVLEYMANVLRLPIDIRYAEGSTRAQCQWLAASGTEYDVLLAGAYSLMFTRDRAAGRYKILFPCAMDSQQAIVRASRSHEAVAATEYISHASRVFYVPDTVNEAFLRSGSVLAPKIEAITLADMMPLSRDLDQGEVLLTWDPNSSPILAERSLRVIPGADVAIPVVVCANKNLLDGDEHSISRSRVRFFVRTFIASWQRCKTRPIRSFTRLASLPGIRAFIAAGAGVR